MNKFWGKNILIYYSNLLKFSEIHKVGSGVHKMGV